MKIKDTTFQRSAIFSVLSWLFIFALIPNALVFMTSLLEPGDNEIVHLSFTLDNYWVLLSPIYGKIFIRSLYIASLCTFASLILAYPFAYFLSRCQQFKNLLLLFVIIPFWTSSLIRAYAIVALLKTHGLINAILLKLGLISIPLQLMYTHTAVVIGLVYNLLPFMILPLYANLEKLDHRLIDAARDLGANRLTILFKILIPLTIPGILAGCMLVFLPAMTMFFIPDLLGGSKTMLLGNLIQNQFLSARNWPVGSAVSIALTITMLFLAWLYKRYSKSNHDAKGLL